MVKQRKVNTSLSHRKLYKNSLKSSGKTGLPDCLRPLIMTLWEYMQSRTR